MASLLLGKTLLGRKFEQDTNKDYIKINDVSMGNSIYGYKMVKGNDISKILVDNLKDQNVVCLVYDAKCGNCFIKNGFNLSSPIDYSDFPGFTTYIVKNRIGRFLKAPLPASIVTPKVVVPSVPVPVISAPEQVPKTQLPPKEPLAVPVVTPVVPTPTPVVTPVVVPTPTPVVPSWNGFRINYVIGSIVSYNGNTYKCITPHTSQSDWLPNVVPALWQLVPSGTVPVATPVVPSVPVVTPSVPSVPVVTPVVPSVPVVTPSVPSVPNTGHKKRCIYYHTNWSMYARNYQIKDIPVQVTDISYAFFNIDAQGNVVQGDSWADSEKRITDGIPPQDSWNDDGLGFYGNFGQIKKLQNSGRKLDVSLSVGGWTWSKFFSPAVSTVATRTNFVNSIIDIFKKYTIFSGISIDWEYVSNDGVNYGNTGNIANKDDCANLILFLIQLRNAFNSNGMANYTIAMCTIADPNKCKFDLENVHPHLDELHIMTYDFHDGAWGETISRFQCNPRKSEFSNFSCEEAADYYISRGVKSTKIFIGAAFYSRGYSNTDGIGKSASGGSPDKSWDTGSVDYKQLPLPGATEYNDPISKAAYSYDPTRRVINTYDNTVSVIEKCKIIYEKNLGGCIVWESSADYPYNHERSLMRTFYDNLTNGRPGSVPSVPVATPSVPSVPSVTPVVPSVPVVTPSVPVVTPVVPSSSRNLSTLLNGKVPIGVYFQAWSSGWAGSGAAMDLSKISAPINIVYLSFVRPETTYTSGRNSLAGTGLDFSSDFSVVKDAIKILRDKGIVVMLSVGGATYPFNTYNAVNVAHLTRDLGCNGIDIDWENHDTRAEFGGYIQKTRDALGPNMCVSTAGFSVGAYGEGEFANAPPVSDYRGMNVQGLKSHGKELDWINIMSYDASPAFSSTQAFDAYRSYYNGPLLIGFEPPPEAWGGHILTLDTVRKHCEYVKNKNGGAFVWSYQKQGPPHCPEIVNLAFEIFKGVVPSVPVVVPFVPSVPVVASQSKTTIAPYIYSWSLGNSVYKIDSLKTAMSKIDLKAASYAFVISDGGSRLNINQQNIDDMKAFVSAGNTLIISCGGANGPFIQDTMNKEQIVASLSGLLNATGSRHLDFDIEGSALPNIPKNNLLNSAIVELQRTYNNLYVSYTIPIGDPKWGAITPDGINLINNAKNMGINISRVNGMIMDLNSNTDWSTMAIGMCEGMHQQLSQIFSGRDIYNLIGATFMCGVEDTNSIFRVKDAQILALYAKQKGLGMVSYWSINRDQIGTGELGVYSKVNTVDYEYYNALTNVLM